MSCQTKVFKMVTKAEPCLKVIYFATFKVNRQKWRNQQKRTPGQLTWTVSVFDHHKITRSAHIRKSI